MAMASSVHGELRKLDDLYRVKADLEQLPYYLRFHPQTTRHFRDLIEETVVSLARCADRRLPGTPQDNMIENILDLRRRWLGSGPLEFQANSRCLSQLDSIVINELKRLSECTTYLLCLCRTSLKTLKEAIYVCCRSRVFRLLYQLGSRANSV